MLEAIALSLIGFLLLAAAAHRFRREVGPLRQGQRRLLRLGGGVSLAGAVLCCGSPLPGEWSVRFLAAISIAATLVVLALSVAPATVLAPLRRIVARR